ncbi:MAG: DUF1207 domain-containing protein [Desulfobacterales bacterium]|nr:DUF1207 domain-containing protein [Desulfobacterales bacterium]
MRKFFVELLIASFFPFIVGFSDVPTDKDIEQDTIKKAIFFPQGQLFFPPMANSKEPRTHATYLNLKLPDDRINIGSIGFGDSFGLARCPGWGDEDAWQLNISGVILAQFNMDSESIDLLNADYIIGFPLSYRNEPWSARLRIFHQSSHLGDEFLLSSQPSDLEEPRINLSFESIELFVAYEWEGIQLTAGSSYIIHSDTDLKRKIIQAGIDYQSKKPVFKPTIRLFAGVLYNTWEETDWNANFNVKAGFNIRSPYAGKRGIQIFGEYYNGNLPFGQFYEVRTEYYGGGINVSF